MVVSVPLAVSLGCHDNHHSVMIRFSAAIPVLVGGEVDVAVVSEVHIAPDAVGAAIECELQSIFF